MSKKDTVPEKKTEDFEALLSALEDKLQRMESDDLSLSDAMQEFQEGIELVKSAQTHLKEAEQVINVLTGQDGADDTEAGGNLPDEK